MASEFRRGRRGTKISEDYIDEIIAKLTHDPAVDRNETLPFDVAELQKNFNAQLESLLERDTDEDSRTFWRKLFSLDECEIFADDETALFVKIFGDNIGLFGIGVANGNFKILSLCFIEPKRRRDIQALNFVFGAFTKIFLPKVDPDEVFGVLRKNYFFTANELLFTLIPSGELNMFNIVVDKEDLT